MSGGEQLRSVIERRRPFALRRRWFVRVVTPAWDMELWVRTRRQAEAVFNAYEGRRQDSPDIAAVLARLDPVVEAMVTPVRFVGHTTDRSDPRLGHGVDDAPVEQHDVYLVLSDEERSRGFVRPVRRSYVHVGPPGPQYPLRQLTDEERGRYDGLDYVMYEEYPEGSGALGRFWTQQQLDQEARGCGSVTTMSLPIAETYAREPGLYGLTYCCACRKHLPVGEHGEFVWDVPYPPFATTAEYQIWLQTVPPRVGT